MFSEKMLHSPLKFGETYRWRYTVDSFEIVARERVKGIVFIKADNIRSLGGNM